MLIVQLDNAGADSSIQLKCWQSSGLISIETSWRATSADSEETWKKFWSLTRTHWAITLSQTLHQVVIEGIW